MEDKKILSFVRRNLLISQGLSRTVDDCLEEQELHIQRCVNALSNSSYKEASQQASNPELSIEQKRDLLWKILSHSNFSLLKFLRTSKSLRFYIAIIAAIIATNQIIQAFRPHLPWATEFYGNPDLQGEPIARREDKDINFHWESTEPHKRVDAGRFSAKFISCLVLDKDKTLNFRLGSDDGSRLFIDGEKILESWQIQGYAEMFTEHRVKAGAHPIEVQYYQDGGGSRLEFEIENAGTGQLLTSTFGAFSECIK